MSQSVRSNPSASLLACPENQRILNHLSKVAQRCLVTKREGYRFSILKAIKSVKLFPLPLESLEECLMLDGVGPSIAAEMMKAVVDENIPSKLSTTTKTNKKRAEHPTKGSQSPCAVKSPLLKRPCAPATSACATPVGGSRAPMVCVDLTKDEEEEEEEVIERTGEEYDNAFEYGGVLDDNDWGCLMSSHVEKDSTSSSSARNGPSDFDRPYQHHTLPILDDDDGSFEGKADEEEEEDEVPSLSQLRITNTSKSKPRQPGSNNNKNNSSTNRIPQRPPPPATAAPPLAAVARSDQRVRAHPSVPAPDRPIPSSSNNNSKTDCSGMIPDDFGYLATGSSASNSSSSSSSSSSAPSSSSSSSASCAARRLPGGERAWEAVLLVDTREKDHLMVQSMMIERGVPCEVRTTRDTCHIP